MANIPPVQVNRIDNILEISANKLVVNSNKENVIYRGENRNQQDQLEFSGNSSGIESIRLRSTDSQDHFEILTTENSPEIWIKTGKPDADTFVIHCFDGQSNISMLGAKTESSSKDAIDIIQPVLGQNGELKLKLYNMDLSRILIKEPDGDDIQVGKDLEKDSLKSGILTIKNNNDGNLKLNFHEIEGDRIPDPIERWD
jgi:hypothetical protein